LRPCGKNPEAAIATGKNKFIESEDSLPLTLGERAGVRTSNHLTFFHSNNPKI
jgi:hypothetical protein